MADSNAPGNPPENSERQSGDPIQAEADIMRMINSMSEEEIYSSVTAVPWTSSHARNFILSLSATWDRLTASDADATSLKKLASLWATVLVIEGVGELTLRDSGEDERHLGGQEGCVLAEVDTNIVS
ncbi:hypothetical protein MANI_022125 [Metarhizium anisopliae]|uniref:Uncharacterized protein n=1 Tax=Metarhizium rileyi (strain RCEF 4871) TaxID=1649241 RepID=A0A5C6G6I5_METRR|nr:hypothetical protein MANI_022125 [Metarhizium anisopliae]TWU71456.1 hypothetical protein ED733_001887 [Metarhizium rileyi]